MMAEIPLTQGFVALVDDEDYEFLSQWSWCYKITKKGGYACRGTRIGGKPKMYYMHRTIMDEPACQVDHRNGNKLDNRRSNLRLATSEQNRQNQPKRSDNTSGFKGVSYDKNRGRWKATVRGRLIGRFATAEEAARVCDREARLLYGEFAVLNFPKEIS